MPSNKEGVAPNGNNVNVVQTETRRKVALGNIKNGVKPNAEELLEERAKEGKKNFKEKSKPKKKENFPRDDTKDLLEFVDHCVKQLDTQLVMVPVSNKQIPQEWTLEYKSKRVAWICPRASMRFGVYLFLKGHRDIIKVYTKEDMDDVFSRIKARCAELDEEPDKPKTSKKGQGGAISHRQVRDNGAKSKELQRLKWLWARNIKVTQDVMDWCEKKGYKLQSRSIKW